MPLGERYMAGSTTLHRFSWSDAGRTVKDQLQPKEVLEQHTHTHTHTHTQAGTKGVRAFVR